MLQRLLGGPKSGEMQVAQWPVRADRGGLEQQPLRGGHKRAVVGVRGPMASCGLEGE